MINEKDCLMRLISEFFLVYMIILFQLLYIVINTFTFTRCDKLENKMLSVRYNILVVILISFSHADCRKAAVYRNLFNADEKPIPIRPIKVLVKESPPFSYHLTNETYGGIEVKLIEEIAKELNLKIEYIFYDGDIAINHKNVER